MPRVQEYTNHFIQIWENSSQTFPSFRNIYSQEEQRERENSFEKFQDKLRSFESRSKIKELRKDPGESFFPLFTKFLETIFDFDKNHLSLILSDDFRNVSKDFFYKARSFDAGLKPENIYQAIRNVWIMNGLQLMANVPVKITPSVFAYSMTYPYSDNFLDDPNVSEIDKQHFSERFNRRLHGDKLEASNFTEKQLYRLVELFEEEFPREKFEAVYQSIYAIQNAQTDSLKLNMAEKLSNAEVQSICFQKGGTSVLADGYLVAGHLTEAQERALFGYGIYLQLLDDIQDLEEDTKAGTKTLFSTLKPDELPAMINKTVHFGRITLNEMRCFSGVQNQEFLNLMNRSIETMLIEALGLNNTWFTASYVQQMEKHSPIGFNFVRKKKAQNKSQRFAMFAKYFQSAPLEKFSID